MYSRVRASSADPAGRGPNSTCLRTCSKARAPSIFRRGPAFVCEGEAAGVAPVPTLLFLLESPPGQAVKAMGIVRMRKSTKHFRAFFTGEAFVSLFDDEFID